MVAAAAVYARSSPRQHVCYSRPRPSTSGTDLVGLCYAA